MKKQETDTRLGSTAGSNGGWLPVPAIGPHQINPQGTTELGTPIVTVTYPVGSDTVLSIQPGGQPETRPAGSNGIYERALQYADRLVYAPRGAEGAVFLVPFAQELPN